MTSEQQIILSLRGISQSPTQCFIATVVRVDSDAGTVDVTALDGTTYNDVRLQASAGSGSEGITITPTEGSYVLISRIERFNEFYVAMFSKIDRVNLKIEGQTIEVAKDGVVINEGKNSGLVRVKELEKSLNSIKKYVEAINTALPSAFTAIGAGLAAAGANGATAYSQSMAGKIVEISGDLENSNVKH